MNFSNQIVLSEKRKDAEDAFSLMRKRLESLRSMLDERTDGNDSGGLIGRCVATCAWAVAFIIVIWLLRGYGKTPYLIPITSILSILIIALLLIMDILMQRYYSSVLHFRSEIDRMRDNLNYSINALSGMHQEMMGKKAHSWAAQLQIVPSLYTETDRIESEVTSMEGFRDGALQKLLVVVYYPLCVAWTVLLSLFISQYFYDIAYGIANSIDVYVSKDFIFTLGIILTVIAAIAEVFIAKLIWGRTGCSVTNTTLFSILVGPLITIGLAIVCILITYLIYLIVLLLHVALYIFGIIIAIGIAASFSSGG